MEIRIHVSDIELTVAWAEFQVFRESCFSIPVSVSCSVLNVEAPYQVVPFLDFLQEEVKREQRRRAWVKAF